MVQLCETGHIAGDREDAEQIFTDTWYWKGLFNMSGIFRAKKEWGGGRTVEQQVQCGSLRRETPPVTVWARARLEGSLCASLGCDRLEKAAGPKKHFMD